MNEQSMSRRATILAGLVGLTIGLMLLLTLSSTARAGEADFCYKVTLAPFDQPGFTCGESTKRYLTGVYGQGSTGGVCVGDFEYVGGLTCSTVPSWGVYNSNYDGTEAARASIYNASGKSQLVSGHVWWHDPVPPSWHSENLGGTLTSDPDICSWGAGTHYEVVARGTDNALWHRYWTTTSGWGNWESLGGTLASGPGCVSWGPNRVDIVARASNNTVLRWYWNGTSWQMDNLGGNITYDPDIASTEQNKLDVFGRASDGSIAHRWWNGSGWGSWENLGGANAISRGVSAVGSGGNRVDVVGRAPSGSVFHLYYYGGWFTESFGGITESDPDMSSWEPGVYDVWMRGTDNGLWHKYWTGSSWADWASTGIGGMASSPGTVSPRKGRHDVVFLNQSGNVIHWYWE